VEQSELKVVRVDGQVYMVPARALTLSPPWHYLMLHVPPPARKDVENRVPGFNGHKFRGWCWVHAAGAFKVGDYQAATEAAYAHGVQLGEWPTYEAFRAGKTMDGHPLPRGGVVGAFNVTGYMPPTEHPTMPWHFKNHHGFPVANATPVPFVPCPGMLGFWRVPYDILCQAVRGCVQAGVALPFIKPHGVDAHA